MKRISLLLLVAAACGSNDVGGGNGSGSGSGSGSDDQWDTLLNSREVDYNAALRIASLRLVGHLPTMAEINQIATQPDDASKQAQYNLLIKQYIGTPDFARQMFYFWRDTFKLGGTAELDTAPALAAMLSVQNGSYMSLFTQPSGNCPTFDMNAGTFAAAECNNNGPKAGVLTNPGVMKQFYSNFAFRRVRWIQEVFDCTKFPAEVATAPVDVGGSSPYTGVWPF
jgi:hypothetical protein